MNEIENKPSEITKHDRLGVLKQVYCQPTFLITAILLAIAGGGMSIAINKLGIILTKEPLALKKPLELLSDKEPDRIGHYKVIAKKELSKDMIKALGTSDYIQWTLEDTEVADDSSVRNCSFFVTYYGNADRIVTHVPDECYIGGGYEPQGDESLKLQIKDGNEPLVTKELTTRCIDFGAKTQDGLSDGNFSVLYFFYADGVYTGSRTATRTVLNKNIFAKHSYYSKIEWSFSGTKSGTRLSPAKAEVINASQKLLGIILPILEKEHWPDKDSNGISGL